MNEIAISLNNISKKYKIYNKPSDKLKEAMWWLALRKRKQYYRDFWALKNINLEIPKGTTFGIIGQNGSGKSTLLQVIAGILQPTTGTFNVDGRISALLELGSGFSREFTGRENVFMKGAIMGISHKEMEERFDEIADFADIGEFIDQPVKTYSSGMHIRLAFATAINVDPDILIIDEALAVGDDIFKRRCYRNFEAFQKQGKTIVFVSHSINTVITICNSAILLNNGAILQEGSPKEVTRVYIDLNRKSEEEYRKRLTSKDIITLPDSQASSVSELRVTKKKDFSSGGAKITETQIIDPEAGGSTSILQSGKSYTIKINVTFEKYVKNPAVGFGIFTLQGMLIYGVNSFMLSHKISNKSNGDSITVNFKQNIILNKGSYSLMVGVNQNIDGHIEILEKLRDFMTFKVIGTNEFIGLVDMATEVEVLDNEQ